MHLADFNTDQSEIDVYCGNHIPKDISKGVVWKRKNQNKPIDVQIENLSSHKRVFVLCKTKNAAANWNGNHPNFDCDIVESMFGQNYQKEYK